LPLFTFLNLLLFTAGGLYGCDLMDDLRLAGYIDNEEAQINICKNWAFYIKEMYRDNFILPQSNCTVDENDPNNSQNCGTFFFRGFFV
jgi:hypothetical protein